MTLLKKAQVLCEYLRADWLRLVDILPDLYKYILPQKNNFVKKSPGKYGKGIKMDGTGDDISVPDF